MGLLGRYFPRILIDILHIYIYICIYIYIPRYILKIKQKLISRFQGTPLSS